MSFPYTTTSPPPTSGALVVVGEANSSSGPYGGGSGPGPSPSTIGPDPSVSSITLSPTGNGVILGTGAGNTQSQIVWTTSIDGAESFQAYWRNGQSGDVLMNNKSLAFTAYSTNTDLGTAPLDVLAINFKQNEGSPATGVIAANAGGIYLTNVSSINGALPGGAVPANLNVSSLSVNDTGNITLDWNNGGGTLNFGFEATNTSSFILQQGIGVVGTKVAGPEGCLQVLEKDGGANQVFAPLQASGFEVCATAYPGGAFAGLYFSSIGSVLYSAVGQPLTIDAPAGVSVSSLSVSSINGAAPGGSVGPALGTSSITASTVTFANTSTSGMFFAADGSLVNKAVGISLTPLTGQYGNSRVVGAWGEEVYGGGPGWAEFATQRLYVTDSQGAATNATYIQNIANTVSVNAPNIVMNGPTSVSSLTVSSINGAAPGGGMSFSTIGIPGGAGLSTFGLVASQTNTLVPFSTIAGHVYSISIGARAQLGAVPADTDILYSEVVDSASGNEVLGLWPLSQVSTLTNASENCQVGGSGMWKAGGTGAFFSLLPSASGATARVDRVVLMDFGAV